MQTRKSRKLFLNIDIFSFFENQQQTNKKLISLTLLTLEKKRKFLFFLSIISIFIQIEIFYVCVLFALDLTCVCCCCCCFWLLSFFSNLLIAIYYLKNKKLKLTKKENKE